MEGYVKGTSRALRQRRQRGHKVTNDINAAVYGNLSGTIGAAKKGMTRNTARVTSRIAELQSRASNVGVRHLRATRRAEATAVDRFGGALMAGSTKQYRKGVKAAGKAGAIAVGGALKGAKVVGKSGSTALDIAQAGATEAQAGAEYYTGAALKERTSADIQFIAGLRHDIAMTKMQAQIAEQQAQAEFERQKKLARFEANLLEQETGAETMSAVKPFVNLLTEITPQVIAMQEKNKKLDEEDRLTPEEMVARLEEQGTLRDPAEVQAATTLIRQLTNNNQDGPDNIIAEVVRSVPGWTTLGRGEKDRLRQYIRRELQAEQARLRKLFGQDRDDEDNPTPAPSPQDMSEWREEQERKYGKNAPYLHPEPDDFR